MECFDDGISRGECGLSDVFVLEIHGVRAMGSYGFDKNMMCSVVSKGAANVPTISGMLDPGASVTRFHMTK